MLFDLDLKQSTWNLEMEAFKQREKWEKKMTEMGKADLLKLLEDKKNKEQFIIGYAMFLAVMYRKRDRHNVYLIIKKIAARLRIPQTKIDRFMSEFWNDFSGFCAFDQYTGKHEIE